MTLYNDSIFWNADIFYNGGADGQSGVRRIAAAESQRNSHPQVIYEREKREEEEAIKMLLKIGYNYFFH